MDISGRIRDLRKKCGLNQFELSEEVGVSVDSIRRWESNKQFPRADELSDLASVLKVTVDELLNGTQKGKAELVISWNWEDMKKGEMKMEDNKFKLVLGEDGQIGINGMGRITSLEGIEEFLGRVREQLTIALEAQVKRGAIQPSVQGA